MSLEVTVGCQLHQYLLFGWHFLGLNGSQDLPHPLDLHPIPDLQAREVLSLWPGSQKHSSLSHRQMALRPRHPGYVTPATSLPPDGGGGILQGKVGSSR